MKKYPIPIHDKKNLAEKEEKRRTSSPWFLNKNPIALAEESLLIILNGNKRNAFA